MESSSLTFTLLAALHLLFPCLVHAQYLTAVKCNGTLPSGRYYFSILYDKNDSIYLFGGENGNPVFNDVIKYSISNDTAEIVGQLPFGDEIGSAVINNLGNIFYLPGVAGNGIYQYFPDLRSFVNVSSLPLNDFFFATLSPDNDTALLIGGYPSPNSITSLNLNTLKSEIIAQLPEDADIPAAIWVEEKEAAYIFDWFTKRIQKYSRVNNTTKTLSAQVPMQSMGSYGAVSDGKYGYLIGTNSAIHPSQSLAQFDPVTETFAFIRVEGYAPMLEAYAVYVEKLNRIYTFGGRSWTREDGNVYHDAIYYIDLDPLNGDWK